MHKRLLIALGVLAGFAAAAALAGSLAWRQLHAPMGIAETGTWLEVPSGTPLRKVTTDLADRGVLEHPWLLTAYGRLRGAATRIHAGEYRLAAGTTPAALLADLVSGGVYLHRLTVVEGWRFTDLLKAVRGHPAIVASDLDEAGIMAALGEPDLRAEGQFFPDTYRFPKGTKDVELLRVAHEALRAKLAEAWSERTGDSALTDAYDALILASIIEKETALAGERRLISGVFHRRLQLGRRLETDPTVIYGLGDDFNGNLTHENLSRDTPYNTYTRRGLPPTPIALPGSASLKAAVDPEITDALYFVATGRPDGSHYFSATFEEHSNAVRDYLRQSRSRPE